MYEKYYGFKLKPFSLLPEPKFLYLSKQHSFAYAMLQYAMQNEGGGYTVVTGEIGSGKTTLIRKLLAEISDQMNIGTVSQTYCDYDGLLRLIMATFNLDYKGRSNVELYQDFVRFVSRCYQSGSRTILIIDEAQNLSIETLESLRMLSNINTDQGQMLQLILVGQPELLQTLSSPQLLQFAQRVAVQYHLPPLLKQEGINYIKHRLQVANGDQDLFDESACVAIWYYSRGIPRVINTICDLTLVYAFAEQRKSIDLDLVRKVIQDRKSGGLFGENIYNGVSAGTAALTDLAEV